VFENFASGADSSTALIVLLLAERCWYRAIRKANFASPTLICAVKRGFAVARLKGALRTEEAPATVPSWLLIVVRWLLKSTPKDFGFFRTRWSCALLALLLWEQEGIRLSPETVRRGPRDPQHARKVRDIQRFIAALPADETVVFQDEVDVHLDPKIGSMWMPRGQQAEVVTPGNNEKRHLAGSLHWRTGRLLLSAPGAKRNASLFLAHLDDLRRQLRSYRVIHVVCDNAKFHDCRAVHDYQLRHGQRIVLHFLPKYAPETNPIERVWWHLHETITRNHRCQSIDELLGEVTDWVRAQKTFYLQTASGRRQP
jgi:putative transposase